MSGRLGTREADELIEQKRQRSRQLHEAMAQTIGLDDVSLVIADLLGTDIAPPSGHFSVDVNIHPQQLIATECYTVLETAVAGTQGHPLKQRQLTCAAHVLPMRSI